MSRIKIFVILTYNLYTYLYLRLFTMKTKTLLMRDDGNSVQDEPVVDSYNDISVYGIMAQVVSRGKWAK